MPAALHARYSSNPYAQVTGESWVEPNQCEPTDASIARNLARKPRLAASRKHKYAEGILVG
jgi:hypothetical protein